MRYSLLALLLVAACAQPPRPTVGRIPQGEVEPVKGTEARRVRLQFADALGVPVRLGEQARVTVVVLFSTDSANESAELMNGLDEKLLNGPVELVSAVDLRRYNGRLTRSIATRRLKQSAEKGKVRRRERRLARGVDASPEVVDRWHLVGDFDGTIFKALGVEPDPILPVAVVVDLSGVVSGPYRDRDAVLAAVDQAIAARASVARNAAEVSSARRAPR